MVSISNSGLEISKIEFLRLIEKSVCLYTAGAQILVGMFWKIFAMSSAPRAHPTPDPQTRPNFENRAFYHLPRTPDPNPWTNSRSRIPNSENPTIISKSSNFRKTSNLKFKRFVRKSVGIFWKILRWAPPHSPARTRELIKWEMAPTSQTCLSGFRVLTS